MKFTRRPDLDPQTRIEIVKDVWINQGIYGKMTQIAQHYHIGRSRSAAAFNSHGLRDFLSRYSAVMITQV